MPGPGTDLCQALRPRLLPLEQIPVSKIGIANRHTHSSAYRPKEGSVGRAGLSEKIREEPIGRWACKQRENILDGENSMFKTMEGGSESGRVVGR